jgi:hypothetical protein
MVLVYGSTDGAMVTCTFSNSFDISLAKERSVSESRFTANGCRIICIRWVNKQSQILNVYLPITLTSEKSLTHVGEIQKKLYLCPEEVYAADKCDGTSACDSAAVGDSNTQKTHCKDACGCIIGALVMVHRA